MNRRGGERVLLLALLCFASVAHTAEPHSSPTASSSVPSRVVSLAPSLTEVVFALGAEKKLVGVTRYCDYPPEAKELPEVGGLLDPSYEVLVTLKPDLVLLLGDHAGTRDRLRALGIRTISQTNNSTEAIIHSIKNIGEILGREGASRDLVKGLRRRIQAVRTQAAARLSGNQKPPRVLVTIGGHANRTGLDRVLVAGKKSIFSELVEICGGVNAYQGSILFPPFSAEGMAELDPDIILDVIPNTPGYPVEVDEVYRMWQNVPGLRAAKGNRVHVIAEEYAVNPGPRITDTLELFAKHILHDHR
jgi:iron complex transport system substrate-binding protein